MHSHSGARKKVVLYIQYYIRMKLNLSTIGPRPRHMRLSREAPERSNAKREMVAAMSAMKYIALKIAITREKRITTKQYLSLEKILRKWKSLYPEAEIVGHRDTGNTDKTCTNFDVKTWAKDKFT